MLDLVIRGGQVVTPQGVGAWDVGVEGERIVAVAAPGTLPRDVARVVDATGKLVIPGGIDPHVHTHWPIPALGGGHTTSAPPEQVSRAAIFGGTTTLVDFAVWEPGLTLARAIEEKEKVWRQGYTDYGLHVMLQGAVPPEVIDQIPEAIQGGFASFKIFTTDVRPIGKGRMIRMGHLWAIMEKAARHGGILAIHAEDDDLVMYMYERLEREGRTDIEHMPLVHSAMSEDISFRRVLRLARYVEGAAVYFVHVSAGAGVEAIAEARGEGRAIYGETLHHYASVHRGGLSAARRRDVPHVPLAQARGGSPAALGRAQERHAQHRRHRRAVHAARDQGAQPARRRRHRRPRRRGDARADHLHRGRVQAGDVARAVRRRHVEQCGEDPRALSAQGRDRPGQRRRSGRLRSDRPAHAALGRSARLRLQRLGRLGGARLAQLVILRGKIVVENGKLSGQAGDGRRVPGKLAAAIQDGPAV